jgi:hypothetical protein
VLTLVRLLDIESAGPISLQDFAMQLQIEPFALDVFGHTRPDNHIVTRERSRSAPCAF